MVKKKQHEFEKYTPKGRRFIKLWNKADRRGIRKKIADEFDISVEMVHIIRKKLELQPLHSPDHPGTKALRKRIRKLYWNDRSTLQISRILRMSEENVRKILHKEGVQMKPQYVVNPLYFPFAKNDRGHTTVLKEIKKEYQEGKTVAEIARERGFDAMAVAKKLKNLGIEFRQHHQPLPGGYPCEWCGEIMERVWQNSGPRKQRFCGGSCKNRVKEFRRLTRIEDKGSSASLDRMHTYLRSVWKEEYDEHVKKLLERREPCIKT